MTKCELKRYPVTTITHQDYLKMVSGGEILMSPNHYNKQVVLMPDDKIIKCLKYETNEWRHLRSRIQRLLMVIQKLTKRGIKTMQLIAAYDCPEQQAYVISYYKVPGISIDNLLRQNTDQAYRQRMLCKTVEFLEVLHSRGINCRSAHAGNILYDNGQFALIDMEKTKFLVTARSRARAVCYLLTHSVKGKIESNTPAKTTQEITISVQAYLIKAQLSKCARKLFIYFFNQYLKKHIQRVNKCNELPLSINLNYRYSD